MPSERQQQRTASTVGLLLESATRLFGERGYANTSLEDIAIDCDLTIGAIYHHFGNKKSLFSAVNEAAEQRIIAAYNNIAEDNSATQLHNQWQAFTSLCNEAGFRQIVLIDSPNILGRDRWVTSAVTLRTAVATQAGNRRRELQLRILRGAMTEAALVLAESGNNKATRQLVDDIIREWLTAISQPHTTGNSHKDQ
jgi:AcrR family transcriptional regulator